MKIKDTIYGDGKKLIDLGRNECRWPVGEKPTVLFCAAHVEKGSYCEKHKTINHVKTREHEPRS